jgi:uncharacterized protein with HEPN domain
MKDDRFYLLHIRDACEQIMALARDGERVFHTDRKTQDAMIRNFQIIGEAAKIVSTSLKERKQDIPWREIAGMRNRLVHDYFDVDLDVVWDTASTQVAGLYHQIKALIVELGGERLDS